MARSRSTEDQLKALAGLRGRPVDEQTIEQLGDALHSRSCHVTARAARIVGELGIHQLEGALIEAFDRFMADPVRRDPGCVAKTAAVEALDRLDSQQTAPFDRGIRHVQLEAAWGEPVDTAAALRGTSALALVRLGRPGMLLELARLLADKDPEARGLAARALGGTGRAAAIPLLVFKIHTGDPEPGVLGECFASVLTMEPEAGLDLVAEQLEKDDDAVAEAAAVALGESRLDEAFEPLTRALETSRGQERRRALLLGLALLRRDRAIDHLVAIVAEGSGTDPADALEALRIYRSDSTLRERLNDIVDRSGDRALARTLAETFS